MATTLFEDKLSDYLAIADKASHGYYISNGVYHQNLEKIDIDDFVIAVMTVQKMLNVAFQNQTNLMSNTESKISNPAFWNNLKRQKLRFDSIAEHQLNLASNHNNVTEIISEVQNNNEQVITQLKKAEDYNLLLLPIVFLNILGEDAKATEFENLRQKLVNTDILNRDKIKSVDLDISSVTYQIVDDKEVLSWFSAKEDMISAKKQEAKQQLANSKAQIEQEKQDAIDNANKETEKAMEEAKKVQEDALKLMAEMQKKYGL